MAMLMAIIITSVCSFICLLWLIFTTAMRMRVMGNVAITTNVLESQYVAKYTEHDNG